MGVRFHLALDSGAHSLFNRYIAPAVRGGVGGENVSVRAHIHNRFDTSYLRSKDFRKYLDRYVEYVQLNQKKLDFCVGLDIIFDPKRSYDLWDELDKQGVKTVPVIHYGEDPSWLKKYMDRCELIGIGGLGQTVNKATYHGWARGIFRLLTDKKGQPKWQTHGFAMSSFDLMRTYPWTSVDSSSPLYFSRMGSLCVPRFVSKAVGNTYMKEPGTVALTPRRSASKASYLNAKPSWKHQIDQHIKALGFTLEQLANSYTHRDIANLMLFNRTAQEISKQRDCAPLKLYVSGKPGAGEDLFVESLPLLAEHGVHDINYLGTFFLPKPTDYFLAKGLHNGRTGGNRPRLKG